MKKLLTLLFFIPVIVKAQDAVPITISVQSRDWEYITGAYYFNDATENLYDSVKIKFRVQTPPANTTVVSVTGVTSDFIYIMARLEGDHIALKAAAASRFEALLRAVGQTYLTARLDAYDTDDANNYSQVRQTGRFKLRRQ